MFLKPRIRPVAALLVLTMLLTMIAMPTPSAAGRGPAPASAENWRPPPDLPGMYSTSTILLIGLGTALVVTLLVVSTRRKPKLPKNSPQPPAPADTTDGASPADSTREGVLLPGIRNADPRFGRGTGFATPADFAMPSAPSWATGAGAPSTLSDTRLELVIGAREKAVTAGLALKF